jgi:hypothetical protein
MNLKHVSNAHQFFYVLLLILLIPFFTLNIITPIEITLTDGIYRLVSIVPSKLSTGSLSLGLN